MRLVLIGFALCVAAVPAQAALNVFGSTIARECYQAALANTGSGVQLCDRALANEQLTPRDKAATLVNRGIIYNASRRLDLSIADFNAALAIDQNLGEAYLNRGNAHFFRRQFPEALADYSKAIDLKIGNLDYAHYNRALVYEMTNKLEDAKADLQAALAVSPQFKAATDRIAVIDQLIGEGAYAPSPSISAPPTASP